MKKAIVLEAAKTGIYPAGITIKDLAEARDCIGYTGLHLAAINGHLLPGTTVQDLSSVQENKGYTPLHDACMTNHLPVGTTAHDLASVAAHDGVTALHTAAECCHLPAETTIKDLLSVRDNNGKTAFDSLMDEKFLRVRDKAKTQIKQVLVVSAASAGVNCTSAQLREIGQQLGKIHPEATGHWMTTEITKRQNAKLRVP
jgi:hypothetical protein